MKNLKIPGKRVRIELRWLLASFVLAFLLNAWSVLRLKSTWTELFTSLHIVLLMALILYVLLLFFRGLGSLILRFTPKNKDD